MRGASLILLQFSCRVLCHNIKSTQRRPTCVQYAITGLRFAPPPALYPVGAPVDGIQYVGFGAHFSCLGFS